jgi:cysteinyl-tRNA synthetase
VNSKRVLDRFYGALDLVNVPVEASQIPEPVMIYLLDDLNVPGALSVLHELAGKIFKDAATLPASELMRLGAELKASGNLLGLLERSPEQWFKGIQKTGANFEESSKELSASQIEALIDARNQAKAAKDFARADEIRQLLLDKGYVLLDTQAGTTWRRK